MRITRLFYPDNLECNTHIHLDKGASSHLIRVLRTKPGTNVILFNGNGKQYCGKTLDTNQKKLTIEVLTEQIINRESPLKISLIQGVSRNDRMDFCIQKATELGVHQIIPVICERSNFRSVKNRQLKKLSHWQSIATSACEQSERNIIPTIEPLQTLTTYLEKEIPHKLKLFLNPDAERSLKTLNPDIEKINHKMLSILVGPEGGLSGQEINFLRKLSWNDIKIGPRVLRTETAGPAIIASLQMLWGDF